MPRVQLPLHRPSASALELVDKNAAQIPEERRWRWKHEMTAPVPDGVACPLPGRAIVELVNTCNLDCPMCRVGRHGVNLDRIMPIELFERVLAALKPSLREVRLNGLGEATLHPHFAAFVRRIRAAGLVGELITNLTCDDETIRLLVDAEFTVLVSWDAATPRLFEALRRPASFASTWASLRALGSAAAAAGRSDHLHLMMTLQRANFSELAGVVELAAEAGVPHVVVNVIKLADESWIERHWGAIEAAIARAREVATTRGIRLFIPDHLGHRSLHVGASPTPTTRGCDRPWNEIVIRYNGEIGVCNMFNPYVYGHVNRHGVDGAWRGPLAHAFRKLVNTPDRHPYCEGCYYLEDLYSQRQGARG